VANPPDDVTRELERVPRDAAATPVQRRSCPNCGAPNSIRRELCGRCGADLDSGAIPPRAEPRPVAPTAEDDADTVPDVTRRWLGGVVLTAVLVLLLLVGLGYAGFGPFDRGPEVPQANFEAERYDGDPRSLDLSDLATSTTLDPQGGEVYEATNMADGDPTTAWNSDGDRNPDGVGELIDLFLQEPAWVQRIVLRNGDHGDRDAFAANARLKRVQVTLDGGTTVVVNFLDEATQEQAVEFSQPELTTSMRIEVLETFAGDTQPDLAISSLELEGWIAEGDDVDIARDRAKARPAAVQ
jgi:hypothetical protein